MIPCSSDFPSDRGERKQSPIFLTALKLANGWCLSPHGADDPGAAGPPLPPTEDPVTLPSAAQVVDISLLRVRGTVAFVEAPGYDITAGNSHSNRSRQHTCPDEPYCQ